MLKWKNKLRVKCILAIVSFVLGCYCGFSDCWAASIENSLPVAISNDSCPKDIASRNLGELKFGKVVETMSASGYTYVLIDNGTKKFWVAGPQKVVTVGVGEEVFITEGSAMANFESKSLKRTFDRVIFSSEIFLLARCQELAEHGDVGVQNFLGWVYSTALGVARYEKEAVKWYGRAAEQGDENGQYHLGVMYSIGAGVAMDDIEVAKWFTKAAEKGHKEAQKRLGDMYGYGVLGVDKDYKQAARWYNMVAMQGDATEQYDIGELYEKGNGVAQDAQEAVKWYTKAAERGHLEAQFNLGLMYANGQGVAQDYRESVKWYIKAAEQGDSSAQYNLGLKYDNGQGVVQDYKEAIKWYAKAAEQGQASAQFNLGIMYANGQGVAQNYIYAYVWSSLAAAQGKSPQNRDSYGQRLTPQQLMEAQALATKIQEQIEHPELKSTSSSKSAKLESVVVGTNAPKVKGTGSAFVITRDGFLLTCYHVIEGASAIKVKVGNKEYPAELIRIDKFNDLALLKIMGSFQALPFAQERSAKMGQDVFTVGFPDPLLQGVNAKLTKGEVNSLSGYRDDARLYQISIPVQPGNSGGPLLDMNGNVTGLIVAMLDAQTVFALSGSLPQNVNYAIKSSYALALLDSVPEAANNLVSPTAKQSFDKTVGLVNRGVGLVLAYE